MSIHDDHKRPQPLIVELQYAFVERYKEYGRQVSYFSKKNGASDSVRAFRFSYDDNGVPHMQVKGSATGPVWYGISSTPNGVGWIILPMVPPSAPQPKASPDFHIDPVYAKRMLNGQIKKYCEDNKRKLMYEHFKHMVDHGELYSTPLTPDELSIGSLM